MLSGILVGIFGNAIFSMIRGVSYDLFGDRDENLNDRIYESLEKATEAFFEKYDEIYDPHGSFLARETNIELIIKSFFYSKDINLLRDLDRQGFGDIPDVSESHLSSFLEILTEITQNDFLLNKIETQKRHYKVTQELGNDVKKILDSIERLPSKDAENKPNWVFRDEKTGQKIPIETNKKYTERFSNGAEIEYMFNENGTVHVNYKDIYGRVTYTELDLDGNIKNTKLPFNLSEYTLVLPREEIITKSINHSAKGYEETFTLKWGRSGKAKYDDNDKLIDISLSGSWLISANDKTIIPD